MQFFGVLEGDSSTPQGFRLHTQTSTTCEPKPKLQPKQVATCSTARLVLNINALRDVCVCMWVVPCVFTRRLVRSYNECYWVQLQEQCLQKAAESRVKWGDKMQCSTVIYSEVLQEAFFSPAERRSKLHQGPQLTNSDNYTALKLIYTAAYSKEKKTKK